MAIAQNFPIISPSLNLDFANVQALDPRITYTRASTATYYGTRTALAEQNLLLQSQTFDNASWSKLGSTVTANAAVSPDGTSTASLLISSLASTDSYLRQEPVIPTGGTDVLTVYAKYLNYRYVVVNIRTGVSARYCWFDVLNGVVATNNSGGTASMQSVGNGWYRLILSRANEGSTLRCNFYLATTDAVLTIVGDGVSGNYFWGAQFEKRDQATAYAPTTTQPVNNYIPALETAASGVARFDHNPVTFESLGFLVEQLSTNLLLQSEDLDTTWSETRATLSLNSVIAPNGTLTADVLIANTDNDTHFTTQTFTGTAVSHTFSAYAKANGLNHIALRLFNGSTQVGLAYYNLSTGATGTVTAGTASIQSVGNGWYRCSLTATLAASASCTADIFLANADNTNSFVGNAFSGVTLWGFQIEALALSTSYIPTVASQVTRAADAASMTGTNFSSWYAQGEGTLYVESLAQNTAAANNKNLRLTDGTTSNEIWLGSSSPGTGARSQIILGNVTYFDGSVVNQIIAGQFGKYAVSFETNNTVLCANGTLGTVDTTVAIASSINQLIIIPPSQRAGYYKKIAYYPVAVTSAQLQALTG
jgi:hypothetical protein